MRQRSRRSALTVAAAGLAISGLIGGGIANAHPHDDATLPQQVADKVTNAGVFKHLNTFQKIADRNGGNRVAGSPGHEKSSEYVYNTLKKIRGFNVEYEDFTFRYQGPLSWKLTTDAAGQANVNINALAFSPNTAATGLGGQIVPLNVPATNVAPGCVPEDFAGTVFTGKIALIKRGGCNFAIKQLNAVAAGAVGVIIQNNEANAAQERHGAPPTNTTLGSAADAKVPTGVITIAAGDALRAAAAVKPVNANLDLRTVDEIRTTSNVVAETKFGDKDNQVVIGGHLDSRFEGPGMNDNGSGSATILETAIQFSKLEDRPKNQVKFIWFSAEEEGLLGAEAYVEALTPEQRKKIALMMDFDMMAGTNWGMFVYDGDNSTFPAGEDGVSAGPPGSGAVEQLMKNVLGKRNVPVKETAFDGRSDYGPFIAAGIPASGTATGAEGIKTEEEVALWGGIAGEQYDPYYHEKGDDITNIAPFPLDVNGDVMAYCVGLFANDTSSVNGDRKGNEGPPPVPPAARKAAAPVEVPGIAA